MHRNRVIYVLICINNHVLSYLISMLSATPTALFFLSILHFLIKLHVITKNPRYPIFSLSPSARSVFENLVWFLLLVLKSLMAYVQGYADLVCQVACRHWTCQSPSKVACHIHKSLKSFFEFITCTFQTAFVSHDDHFSNLPFSFLY